MEVKRVRVSVACDACKKRRGKCAGTSPCDYCSEHNVPCCFSTKSKKRGPASKHPKVESSPSSTPPPNNNNNPRVTPPTSAMIQGPPSRYADIKYIEEYLEQFCYLPPFNINNIVSPSSLHHHMVRFTVLAHMAKALGDHERCMEFFGTARQISGQIYDEPTYDSAIAYVLLTCICMLNNDKRAVHYAHLGRSHSKELLHMKEWRSIQLLHQTFVLTLTLDESLSTAQKHSVLSNYISAIKKSDQSSNLSGYLIGAASLFLVIDPYKARREGLLAAIHDINYLPETRDRLLQDIERTELLLNSNLVTCAVRKMGLIVLLRLYRTLVELWSGHYSRACTAAKDMLEFAQRPEAIEVLRNSTVISTIMPNLVAFGTLSVIITEVLKYFQPNPTHLDDAGACSLSINPNITSLLGHHSHHSSSSSPSSDSSQDHRSDLAIITNNNSHIHGSNSPSHNDSPTSTDSHHNTSVHFPMVNSTPSRKQHSLISSLNPPLLDSYSLSNYTSHNSSMYASSMHGHLPSPLALPNPLSSHLHHPSRGSPHSLHSLPLPRPDRYVCNFIQEMPPIKDYYGVQ